MKTNKKLEIKNEEHDTTHAGTENRLKFTDENLTEKAVMFIHSGLVNQTIYCIV